MTIYQAKDEITTLVKHDSLTIEKLKAIIQLTDVQSGKRRGRPPMEINERVNAQYRDWDWTKSDAELSREYGKSYSHVRTIRIRLGKPWVPAKHNVSKLLEERRAWDWKKNDVELATEHKMTRERVRQIRLQLGKKSRSEERQVRRSGEEAAFLEWAAGRKVVPRSEALAVTKISLSSLYNYAARNGITLRKDRQKWSKYPFHLMNWDLPGKYLDQIWGMAHNTAGARRSSLVFQQPKFLTYFGRNKNNPELIAAVEAEKAKAAAWKAQQSESSSK